MKKLLTITLLLLLPMTAQAQWVARAKTTRGGDIVLLASKCAERETWNRMYLATEVGNIRWGCWLATDLHIMVVYSDGSTMAYNYEGWTLNRSGNESGALPGRAF